MPIFPKKSWPAVTEAQIDGRAVSVTVRVSTRAKSYRLALLSGARPVLTVPQRGRWADAEAFLRRHTPWLASRLQRAPAPCPLAAGERFPLRGVPHRIEATSTLRGRVEVVEGEGEPVLRVPGEAAHLPRRLTDWLKAEARRDLRERVGVHANRLGVKPKRLVLKSQTSRWGSCSSAGNLNFNWRLILAPPFVLDYVAAHEVAHLLEMNHSPAFWETLRRTLPDMERGRAWLKSHGAELMAVGLDGAAG